MAETGCCQGHQLARITGFEGVVRARNVELEGENAAKHERRDHQDCDRGEEDLAKPQLALFSAAELFLLLL